MNRKCVSQILPIIVLKKVNPKCCFDWDIFHFLKWLDTSLCHLLLRYNINQQNATECKYFNTFYTFLTDTWLYSRRIDIPNIMFSSNKALTLVTVAKETHAKLIDSYFHCFIYCFVFCQVELNRPMFWFEISKTLNVLFYIGFSW